MAIDTEAPASPASAESSFVHIEAWADGAIQAMSSLALSESPPSMSRSACYPVAISLDEIHKGSAETERKPQPVRPVLAPRRELNRRDSLKRREALLKGKEGSRRRQRWENGRLLGNPYVQPPLPSDWEIRPTHPSHSVPYYLAPLWDAKYATLERERKNREAKAKQQKLKAADASGNIPRELKQQMKRSKGAKGMLQDIEEQVRFFVRKWELKDSDDAQDSLPEPDSEDDEVVFVGRNGTMHDMASPRSSAELPEREALILEGFEDDHGSKFARWLLHNISHYYGLRSWSVAVGNPVRREAYVGLKEVKLKAGKPVSPVTNPLPRPLYALV